MLKILIGYLEKDVSLLSEYDKCVLDRIPPYLHPHGRYAQLCQKMRIIERIRKVNLYQIGQTKSSIGSQEDQEALKKLPKLLATFEAWEKCVKQDVLQYDPNTLGCLVQTHQASSKRPERPVTLELYQRFRESKDIEERKALREEIFKLNCEFLIANEAWEGRGYNPYSIHCNADWMTHL
jgi:hypothetical protein